jgi:hypothetical protein
VNFIEYFKILRTYWNPLVKNKLIIFPHLVLFGLRLPFAWVESLVLKSKIEETKIIQDPIFILGYYRSGTTHLQKLMSLNTQYEKLNIFKSYFPDSFIMLEPWLKPIIQVIFNVFKVKNPIHRCPFNWDLPGEEDIAFALWPKKTSFNWFHAFPSQLDKVLELTIHSREKDFCHDYLYLIKKLTYSFKGKRLVLKSPPHTARIPTLLKLFPKAKFIYIQRDEKETLVSNRYMWDVVKGACFEKVSDAQRDELILKSKSLFEKKYLQDKIHLKPEQLVEVKFDELMENPLEVIQAIYSKLHLDMDVTDNEILRAYLMEEHGKYRGVSLTK